MITVNFSKLHFDEAPKMLTAPPGDKAKELLNAQKQLESGAFLYSRTIPLSIDKAKGATVKDVDGNIYIDFFAGISVMNVGYSNQKALQAAKEQEEKVVNTLDFPNEARINLMKKLDGIAPGNLSGSSKTLFGGPTGSDAIEGAIKLAKFNTGESSLIAFSGGYHGQTSGALSVTSGKAFKERFSPLLANVYFFPYPYPYRPPFGADPKNCGIRAVEHLDDMLGDPYSGIVNPAAIIVEPIQGEGGVVVPPDDFLPELSGLAKDHSIPLIVDEIQSGLGRTGKMFASEHWDVTPDIMPLAKSLGGIGYPLSCCLYHKDLDWDPGSHLGTFRGHSVGMAAGKASIDFIQENNLLDHATEMGNFMLKRLKNLQEETKYIGDVRGKGLFIAVEFVKDKDTKEPHPDLVKKIRVECFKRGLLVWKGGRFGNVIRIQPPLVITKELLEKGLDILSDVIKKQNSQS